MQPALTLSPTAYRFENLTSWLRSEVELWNWYIRVCSASVEWKSCLCDIVGHLVQKPAGKQFQLVETHLVDSQYGEKVLRFGNKQELMIGRDPANDIVLSANAIASKNTRLFLKDDQVCLEDLGGKLGTYISDKKIPPHEIQVLGDGDQFTVFPHRFRVLVERLWMPEGDVRLSDCRLQPLNGALFAQMSLVGWATYAIQAHPSGEHALLQVGAAFLASLQERVLGPLQLRSPASPVPCDDVLPGFIVLSAIERMNRAVRFPVQFSLARAAADFAGSSQRGLLVSVSVGVGGLTGPIRVFLPLQFLSQCKPATASETAPIAPNDLCWAFPVALGFVDLLPEEMAQVGIGDALVIQSGPAVLFPNDFAKGWTLQPDASNFASFRFDKYFERGTSVEANSEAVAASRPEISALPLRVHVVLGEKELTLSDVQTMTPGMILELAATKADPVRLMVNGKMLGEGELVEVEGRLAVRVLRWRSS